MVLACWTVLKFFSTVVMVCIQIVDAVPTSQYHQKPHLQLLFHIVLNEVSECTSLFPVDDEKLFAALPNAGHCLSVEGRILNGIKCLQCLVLYFLLFCCCCVVFLGVPRMLGPSIHPVVIDEWY